LDCYFLTVHKDVVNTPDFLAGVNENCPHANGVVPFEEASNLYYNAIWL